MKSHAVLETIIEFPYKVPSHSAIWRFVHVVTLVPLILLSIMLLFIVGPALLFFELVNYIKGDEN